MGGWKDLPYSCAGKINIVKIAFLPKYLTESNLHIQYNLHQNVKTTFHRNTDTVLTFIWKQRRTQVAKATPSKKYNAGAITILNFKLQHRAIVMGAEWHWLKKNKKQANKQNQL